MASFADFVLLRALTSYGGAEVLRARRVREGGALDPALHLALYGAHSVRDAMLEERLLDVAEASATLRHDAIARIVEVGRAEGSLYAAAEAAEGVDLATLLEHERRRRAVPDAKFVIAVAFSLARIVQDLHDRGDVWAARAPGLAGLFPAGLRADAVVLRKDGALLIRVLAGAADDARAPTPFRAPELQDGPSTAASDVFSVIQVLRALLASDATAQSPPRLPPRGGALPTLLVGGLQARADNRPLLDTVVVTLRDAFADNAPSQSPAAVIANALRREYRTLLLEDPGKEEVAASAIAEVETRRSSIASRRTVLFPQMTRRAPVVSTTSDEELRTIAIPRFVPHDSDTVGRVFTEEGQAPDATVPSSVVVTTSLPSVSLASADLQAPEPQPASILDLAAATMGGGSDKTQKAIRAALLDSGKDLLSSDGSSPWMSAIELSATGAPVPPATTGPPQASGEPATVAGEPAFAAPVFASSDLEHQDTVEMKRSSAPAPDEASRPSSPSGSAAGEPRKK